LTRTPFIKEDDEKKKIPVFQNFIKAIHTTKNAMDKREDKKEVKKEEPKKVICWIWFVFNFIFQI
jgi:hypothetical protein